MKNVNQSLTEKNMKGVCQKCGKPATGRVYADIVILGVLTPVFEYCQTHGAESSLMVSAHAGIWIRNKHGFNGLDFLVTVKSPKGVSVGLVTMDDNQLDLREVESPAKITNSMLSCQGFNIIWEVK